MKNSLKHAVLLMEVCVLLEKAEKAGFGAHVAAVARSYEQLPEADLESIRDRLSKLLRTPTD